ncbi:MAG: hypothetical protein JO112_19930 [Planctomycetes bacterium]|nr:hypothetical protein [Planctomycetota bacterium]
MGYHKREIVRGVYGEVSKIFEEVEEFRDSLAQGNPVMALVELSDLLGAVEGWLEQYHPNVSLNELCKMKDATKRAFQDGTRKSDPPPIAQPPPATPVHPKDRYCLDPGCYYERGHAGRCSDDSGHM